jgi:DNA-binding NtrC family response regulator
VKRGAFRQNTESASAPIRCPTRQATRILLVDDDALIRQACAQLLRCFGYQTETAKDGAVAWKALQANGYELLITDNNMPKVSGVELVEKVRSAHMALPVILASGDLPTKKELDSNPWLQAVAMLVKPFTGDELLGTVERVLRESDNTREQIESLPIFSQGNFGLRAHAVSNPGCL